MLNLTGQKYLPELAEGYEWRLHHNPETSRVDVKIHASTSYGKPVVEYNTVYIADTDNVVDIRDKVLSAAEKIVLFHNPWHPEGGPAIQAALDSLFPPKDDL